MTKKIKILIADDSDLFRERLVTLVKNFSQVKSLIQAKDGDEALEQVRKFRPDVAILDIRMPGKNGIEVTRELKKSERNCVVIITTNYSHSQYKERSLEAGADFFLEKSSLYEQLIEILENIISDIRI